MPKYLIQASYTAEGVQGLLKDGGSKRKAAAEQAIKGLGGRLEVFYFAFGDTDVFADESGSKVVAKTTTGTPAVTEVPVNNGGPSRTRTVDPLIKSHSRKQPQKNSDQPPAENTEASGS